MMMNKTPESQRREGVLKKKTKMDTHSLHDIIMFDVFNHILVKSSMLLTASEENAFNGNRFQNIESLVIYSRR